MASCTQQKETTVGMGQIAAGTGPAQLKAVLGSCIGLALYRPRQETAIFGHIVLPESSGQGTSPGKFADTAVPEMIRILKKSGVSTTGLLAKFTGGASMFGSTGPMQIGQVNAEAVANALKKAGIRVVAEDVGGKSGRRVTFDCQSSELKIEQVGSPPKVL